MISSTLPSVLSRWEITITVRPTIKESSARITSDGASDGQALPLSAGEVLSLFTHQSVIPIRQAYDRLVHLRFLGCVNNICLAGSWTANLDIFTDGALKEHRVL